MGFVVERGALVTAIVNKIKADMPSDFNLVKAYEGELDRYSKKAQISNEIFPAEVGLTTPFALVISKSRPVTEKRGRSLRLRHDISVYVGVDNTHDFNSTDTPSVYALLSKLAFVLHGQVLVKGGGALELEDDGEYLTRTDLFIVYDQKFSSPEIGF